MIKKRARNAVMAYTLGEFTCDLQNEDSTCLLTETEACSASFTSQVSQISSLELLRIPLIPLMNLE